MSLRSALSTVSVIFLLLVSATPVAAQTTPTLTPVAPESVTVGDTFTIEVTISDVTDLSAYEFDLNVDPTLIQLNSASAGPFLSSTGNSTSFLPVDIDNTAGTIGLGEFTLGDTGVTGNGVLVIIEAQALATGNDTLTITNQLLSDSSAVEITGTTSTDTITINDTASPTPTTSPSPSESPTASPSPSESPTPSPSPTPTGAHLSFNGPSQILIDDPFTVNVDFETDQPVAGVDVFIQFDERQLTADAVTPTDLFDTTPVTPIINNGDGTIRFSTLMQPGDSFIGQGTLATIDFTPKALGDTILSFDFTAGSDADSNAISSETGEDILQEPADVIISILDPIELQLELTTPSENEDIGHQVEGELSIEGSDWSTTIQTDTSGQSATIQLNDSSLIGQLSQFVLKVSGFLRARVEVTLQAGSNLLNFGRLRAGDLNDDGIVNTIDLSLMYEQWFGEGSADYNKDNIVNTADYWELLENYLETDE